MIEETRQTNASTNCAYDVWYTGHLDGYTIYMMSEFSSKFGVPKLSWWWLLYIRRFLVTASEL